MEMTDAAVTAKARGLIVFTAVTFDRLNDVRMAMAAGGFSDLAVALGDLDRIGILAGREIKRMPEPVLCLGRVFADQIVWRVTIVACGNTAMAALDPAIVLFLHHMAIRAGLRIVGEIRRALRVDESVCSDAQGQSHSYAERYTGQCRSFDHNARKLSRITPEGRREFRLVDLGQTLDIQKIFFNPLSAFA